MRIVIEIDSTWLWKKQESQGMNMDASEMRFGEIVSDNLNAFYAHLMTGYMDTTIVDFEPVQRIGAPITEPVVIIEGYKGDNLAVIRQHVREVLRRLARGTSWLISREVSEDPALGGM